MEQQSKKKLKNSKKKIPKAYLDIIQMVETKNDFCRNLNWKKFLEVCFGVKKNVIYLGKMDAFMIV